MVGTITDGGTESGIFLNLLGGRFRCNSGDMNRVCTGVTSKGKNRKRLIKSNLGARVRGPGIVCWE